MTDAPETGPETDPDMTAAELALGLLEGDERAAALRRLLSDPAFAREVDDWRGRLSGLFDDYREVDAPLSVADRLQRVETPAPKRSGGGWPVVAVLTALAASVAFFFVSRPPPLVTPPPVMNAPHSYMVAALALSDKSGAVPALIDATTGDVRLTIASLAPKGKSAQLWMIGADGDPQPMGLLADGKPSRIALTPAQRKQLAAGITLAISIEPAGGSPTGKPTGPVVAAGKLSLA